MNRYLFFILLFLPSISLFSEEKEPDFLFNINLRRTFWVVVPGHGWLYSDFSTPLEEIEHGPILRGKDLTEDFTHFLFKWRSVGDYYLRFFYQDFEPMLPGENYLDQEIHQAERTIWVKIVDEKSQRITMISQLKTPLPSILTEEKIKVSDKKIVNSNKRDSSFLWSEHPLFPTEEEFLHLKKSEKEYFENLVGDVDELLFKLGLYYFHLNAPEAMKKSYKCFNEIDKRDPASDLALDSKARADYIHNYYFLIR